MNEASRPDVTLHTLHQDLGAVKGDLREMKGDMREMKRDMRDVKELLNTRLPSPEWPGEMLRALRENTQILGTNTESLRETTHFLRENTRLNEERFTRLDTTLREQTIETHSILRTLAEGQRQLWAEIRALIARIDALIRGRGNGSPAG